MRRGKGEKEEAEERSDFSGKKSEFFEVRIWVEEAIDRHK